MNSLDKDSGLDELQEAAVARLFAAVDTRDAVDRRSKIAPNRYILAVASVIALAVLGAASFTFFGEEDRSIQVGTMTPDQLPTSSQSASPTTLEQSVSTVISDAYTSSGVPIRITVDDTERSANLLNRLDTKLQLDLELGCVYIMLAETRTSLVFPSGSTVDSTDGTITVIHRDGRNFGTVDKPTFFGGSFSDPMTAEPSNETCGAEQTVFVWLT